MKALGNNKAKIQTWFLALQYVICLLHDLISGSNVRIVVISILDRKMHVVADRHPSVYIYFPTDIYTSFLVSASLDSCKYPISPMYILMPQHCGT